MMDRGKPGVAIILASKGKEGYHDDAMEGMKSAYEEFVTAIKDGDEQKGMRALKSFVMMAQDYE